MRHCQVAWSASNHPRCKNLAAIGRKKNRQQTKETNIENSGEGYEWREGRLTNEFFSRLEELLKRFIAA
jgi:hypothetical protein